MGFEESRLRRSWVKPEWLEPDMIDRLKYWGTDSEGSDFSEFEGEYWLLRAMMKTHVSQYTGRVLYDEKDKEENEHTIRSFPPDFVWRVWWYSVKHVRGDVPFYELLNGYRKDLSACVEVKYW